MPQSTILTQELSLANNDFRNQRTRISKNSYVAKKSDKNARGSGCYNLYPVYPTNSNLHKASFSPL